MAFEVTRWDPFQDMVSLQEDMNKLFSDFWGRGTRRGIADEFWAPLVDIEETQDELVVKAEIPGMKKEEIKLQVTGDTLAITGERRSESETKDKTYHRIERSYGKFQRIIGLPSEVQGTKAKASYENGVLVIHLPKTDEAKPKEISIDVK